MKRVALVTAEHLPTLNDDDRRLVPALAARGVTAEAAVWSDARVAWERYDAVVLRSTWDYYQREQEFRAWLDELQARNVRLHNPVPVVRGNLDKRYLRDLEAAGLAVVPGIFLEAPADAARLPQLLAARGWDAAATELVVKPTVAAGGFKTFRTTTGALRADPTPLVDVLQDRAAMIQPFAPEILAQGEWSFLYFGDVFSHAVLKTAKPGEFRVQWTNGGTHRRADPPPPLRTQADAVLARLTPLIGGPRLYTRIDGIVRDGRLLLMEIEVIEPYLFLGEDAGAAERFAEALIKAST